MSKFRLAGIIVIVMAIMFASCRNPSGSPHVHDWGEWTVTIEATCTEDGLETRVCKLKSSHTETQIINHLGHDWSDWDVTTPPTCTEYGVGLRTCSRCSVEGTLMPVLGHDWGEWIETVAPNCTYPGVEEHTCLRDGTHIESRAVSIIPDAHSWGIPTSTANCGQAGTKTTVCIYNAAHFTEEPVPADANVHDWLYEPTKTKDPTCTEPGEETGICRTHGDVVGIIPPLGHNFGPWTESTAPTCTEVGSEIMECQRPGCTESETRPVPAIGHLWGAWAQTSAPTCETEGIETRTCGHDASHKETRPGLPAIGHNWGPWVLKSAATCTTGAVEIHTCSNNTAHTETRTGTILDPAAHNWGAWLPAGSYIGPVDQTRTCTYNSSHKENRSLPQQEVTSSSTWTSARTEINNKNGGTYTLLIGSDFSVNGSTASTFTIPSNPLKVTLKANGGARTISLTSTNGYMLYISNLTTVVLDNNLTLMGKTDNSTVLAQINSGAELIMNNSKITGNKRLITDGTNKSGGVMVLGTLTMNSGSSISGNEGYSGGGVWIDGAGVFNMNGGSISSNKATRGGGVYSSNSTGGTNSKINIRGGQIRNNTASNLGGGIYIGGTSQLRISGDQNDAYIDGVDSQDSNFAASNSEALAKVGTGCITEYGTWSGSTWTTKGTLDTTPYTIYVRNGVLNP